MTDENLVLDKAADGRRRLAEHADKDLLRFITCGSVDDGKSTLLGRLLLESGSIYDDQIAALRRDSEKHGTTDDELDTALLLDGLEDERQQGITIDVAYRYFHTAKRKFIIADSPGHEQFTRNMATAASTAELALVLVDASQGLTTQTKRHAFIVSLLGIKHVILAVNKMDLVNYDPSVFEAIRSDFIEFAKRLDIPDVRAVPLSALRGDNVTQPSPNTLWYEGNSLLHLLENIYVGGAYNLRDLRFPVQWVNRPDATFRGFSGSIASGTLRVGDEVLVLPSKKSTRVARIVTHDGDLPEATVPDSITVTLEDEIDVSRGDMLVRPGNQPHVRSQSDATLIWMSEQSLLPGRPYWVKQTTQRMSCEVTAVKYEVDVHTLHRSPAATLQLNQIGRCRLSFHEPMLFDSYRRNRQTGSFVLVDRITHETVAAGLFLDPEDPTSEKEHWDDAPQGTQLERTISLISHQDRVERWNQKPLTLLITGLSGAGKTTLARNLEKQLFEAGKKCVVLDGQDLRFGISRDLGFSADERSENLRRGAEIAKMINEAGMICLAAFVAPHADVRLRAKNLIGSEQFLHVHLQTGLDVCRQRDRLGRYTAADEGEIANFPGVTFAYEKPENVDLQIVTDELSPQQVCEQVFAYIKRRITPSTE